MTTGGFYYYFSSKSALLDDYFQELCSRRQAQALKKGMIETSCIEKIWLLLEVCSEAAVELGADLVRVMVCNQANMAEDCAETVPDTPSTHVSSRKSAIFFCRIPLRLIFSSVSVDKTSFS